jgi:hypothetical protein
MSGRSRFAPAESPLPPPAAAGFPEIAIKRLFVIFH